MCIVISPIFLARPLYDIKVKPLVRGVRQMETKVLVLEVSHVSVAKGVVYDTREGLDF